MFDNGLLWYSSAQGHGREASMEGRSDGKFVARALGDRFGKEDSMNFVVLKDANGMTKLWTEKFGEIGRIMLFLLTICQYERLCRQMFHLTTKLFFHLIGTEKI